MPTIQEVIKDPAFLSLPAGEQIKVFNSIDDNFASLPDIEKPKVMKSLPLVKLQISLRIKVSQKPFMVKITVIYSTKRLMPCQMHLTGVWFLPILLILIQNMVTDAMS